MQNYLFYYATVPFFIQLLLVLPIRTSRKARKLHHKPNCSICAAAQVQTKVPVPADCLSAARCDSLVVWQVQRTAPGPAPRAHMVVSCG